MKRNSKLALVKRIAGRNAEDARQVALGAQNQLQSNRVQLKQLLDYRKEYSERFVSSANGGIDVADMREFRAFLSRVDHAIVQQRKTIVENQLSCDRFLSHWQEVKRHEQGLDKLLQRRAAEQEKLHQLNEQKASDEGSQNKVFRRR